MKEIVVEDYNGETLPQVTIPLDPQLSGIDNSQRYYRLYNKAKVTLQKTEPPKTASLNEVNYLESVILSLEQASTPSELEEVHKELVDQEYLSVKHSHNTAPKKSSKFLNKGNIKKKQRNKPEAPQPKTYHSSAGRIILVVKNNRQNEKVKTHHRILFNLPGLFKIQLVTFNFPKL